MNIYIFKNIIPEQKKISSVFDAQIELETFKNNKQKIEHIKHVSNRIVRHSL